MKKMKKIIAVILSLVLALPVTTMPVSAATESTEPTVQIFNLETMDSICLRGDSGDCWFTEKHENGTMSYSLPGADKYVFTGVHESSSIPIRIEGKADGTSSWNIEFRDAVFNAPQDRIAVRADNAGTVNITATGENILGRNTTIFEMRGDKKSTINITVPAGKGPSGKENSLSYGLTNDTASFYTGNVDLNLNKTIELSDQVNLGNEYSKTLNYFPSTENYVQGQENTHTYINSEGETVTEPCHGAYAAPSEKEGVHNLKCRCGRVCETESHDKYIYVEADPGDEKTHSIYCKKCGDTIKAKEACIAEDKPVKVTEGVHAYKCRECHREIKREKCVKGKEVEDTGDGRHVYKCEICGGYFGIEEHIPSDDIKVKKEPTETEWGIADCVCKVCGAIMPDMPVVPTGVYYVESAPYSTDSIYRIYVNGEPTIFSPDDIIDSMPPDSTEYPDCSMEIKAKETDEVVVTAYVADDDEEEQVISIYKPGSIFPVFTKQDMTGVKPYEILWSNVETADYSALKDAVDQIPEKLDEYNKDTVAVLLEALDKVVPYISDQSKVDQWTEDVLQALDNLKLKNTEKKETPVEITLGSGDKLVITKEGYQLNSDPLKSWTKPYRLTTAGAVTRGSVVVESGIHDITINDIHLFEKGKVNPFSIKGGAMVNLNLEGENILSSDGNEEMKNIAALNVMEHGVLTISGTGTLKARCNQDGAGIGSNAGEGTGTINIYDGTIEASSEWDGAGIGTGEFGAGGIVRVYGGTITAKSGDDGAGIGGGRQGHLREMSFYGGTDKATGYDGAGIGGGYHGHGGNVNIYGGTIEALAENEGAGIGIGRYGKNGTVRIHGGTVTATTNMSRDGAGIGGSEDTTVDLIEITGGNITANGGDGAGIGGGDDSDGGKIRISGGIIHAFAEGAAAIGGGSAEHAGDILINGGTFYLQGDSIELGTETEVDEQLDKLVINGGCFFNLEGNPLEMGRVDPHPVNTEGEAMYRTLLDVKSTDETPVEDGPAYIKLSDGSKHYITVRNGQTLMYLPDMTYVKTVLDVNTPADFTELDKVVAEIPENLTVYTEASVNKVKEVQNRIDRTLTVKDQNQVNLLTAELDSAVRALRVKGDAKETITDFTLSSSFDKSGTNKFKYRSRGKHVNANPIVKNAAGETLEKDRDYTVTYSKDKRVMPGKYEITVTGKGRYMGTVTKYLVITPEAADNVKVRHSTASGGYDDAYVTWSSSPGASGYQIYARRPSKTSKWTYLGRTTKTSFLEKDLYDGWRYEFKVLPYYKTDDLRYLSTSGYKTVSMTTLKKTSLNTVKKYSSSRVSLSWKDIYGESGYQVRASRSGKTTYFRTTGTSMKLNVARNKKYTYKVRAYKNVTKNGENVRVYGPWSAEKTYTLR